MCHEMFRPLVFACLVIASSACQPQRPGIQTSLANGLAGLVESAGASPIGGNPVTFFGDLFSNEEEALAAKPLELMMSPTF